MTKEKISKFEKKESDEEILQGSLNIALERKRERKKVEVDELVEEAVADLPEELKRIVARDFERMKSYNLEEEDLRKEAEYSTRRIRESYMEKMLNMPNANFSRFEALQGIDELLTEGATIEDFKKVARVSFDLNGLKAVNDQSGDYEKGNRYLAMAAEAIQDEGIRAWAREQGIEYVVSRDGGDEFGVILKSEKPLTKEVLNEFTKMVQEKLLNNEEAGKLLDFNDEGVLLRYIGITEADWAEEKNKKEVLEKIKSEVPQGYRFKAHISAAAATLYDGLIDEENRKETEITKDDPYEKILQKMMGSMFSTSDRAMHENKTEFKKQLPVSDDPHEAFLSKVYARSERERELAGDIDKYIKRYKKLENAYSEIIEYIEAGGTIEGAKEMMEKQKEDLL